MALAFVLALESPIKDLKSALQRCIEYLRAGKPKNGVTHLLKRSIAGSVTRGLVLGSLVKIMAVTLHHELMQCTGSVHHGA